MDIELLIDALLMRENTRQEILGHLSEECPGVTSEIKSRGYSRFSGCTVVAQDGRPQLAGGGRGVADHALTPPQNQKGP